MTHAELVLRAVRWLRYRRCFPVFAEMVTSGPETPDAIGWEHGTSNVIEVKVSRSDFFKDRQKAHASAIDRGMGCRRWYMTPSHLVDVIDLPAWCGLIWIRSTGTLQVVRVAESREVWDHRAEARMLASALRRQQLGVRYDPATARWESYAARQHRLDKERAGR